MTRSQQEATRQLEAAQANWLEAYGWKVAPAGRWVHSMYTQPVKLDDAINLTRAQPLLFGCAR